MFRSRNLIKTIGPTALCIACSIFSPLSILGLQSSALPNWKPNEAVLNQLETANRVDEFSIRPPKEYSLQTQPGPEGAVATAWAGAPRSDGTRPQVMLLTVTLPPEERKTYTLEQVLLQLVAGIRDRRTDWARTPTEKGVINGVVFARTRWNGRDLTTGWKMHGFVYVGIVGETVVQLSSQDIEPHHEAALKLAESSVLTFEHVSR